MLAPADRAWEVIPMDAVAPWEVLAALCGAPEGWVATDADGTVWTGDVGEDWLDAIAAGAPVVARTIASAASVAFGPEFRPKGTANTIVQSARDAYSTGRVTERDYFAFVALTLAGTPEPHLRPTLRACARAAGIADRLVAETIAVLRGARALGHRVAVVSASPRVVVEEAIAAAGLEVDRVIGIELDTTGASVRTPMPYGSGKAELLSELTCDNPVYAALGDSAFDAAMLRAARQPLAVRPRRGLVEAAGAVPGLRLLAAR